MKPIILDLCGGTGAWSAPWKEAGYDVRLITLPENDVRTFIPPQNVYGILAAPPCTMFSLARTTAKKPRDLSEGMEIVKACMNIIWKCREEGNLKFWALENPKGLLRQFLGKPAFTFNPYDFGDPYPKSTDLWGYFNEPKKTPIKLESSMLEKFKINNRPLPKIKGLTQSDKRAITPNGFAVAFYKANWFGRK